MKHTDFVHLHVHTEYSLLDGAIRIDDLLSKAREYKMSAVAMTDHGNMFGAVDFYQRAYKCGIKPIIGCELYMAPRGRFDRHSSSPGPYHLVILAKNREGYDNLVKLTSMGYLEGFYYRPRIDRELLAECSKGLIGLSACLNGEISANLAADNRPEAVKAAGFYREVFGADNFFLELMENGMEQQKTVNEQLIELSGELSLPLVATNDCHYLARSDAEAHEILLCIQTGKTIDDADRMRLPTDHFYFKSPEEMKDSFNYCSDAIKNTLLIAERCNVAIDLNQIYLPKFNIEDGSSPDAHLRRVAQEGLDNILSQMEWSNGDESRQIYRDRLASELDIISSMGFPGYFLIVADFINYAKERKIPVGPGRGSAAGSLVAYALGITNIDPIRYRLYFERFLNPDRKSMPDIDTDFCMEGRDEIIRYVTEKYGPDRVAQIITFGKMQAKAVVRDVGRALNMSYAEVDRIAKMIPNILNIKLEEAIKQEPRLRQEESSNGAVEKLLRLSKSLEGLNRHSSTHAAGVVISDIPLVERVPLCKSPNNDVVTQFSMNDLQAVGLTKFDFLGLRTLTVINHTLKFIMQGRGVAIDVDNLPLGDPKTYQLLVKGHTNGVFQLESAGMKDILVALKPDCIEDIIALIALYRPGPMSMVPEFIGRKQGKIKISYEVPALENILKETYGVILYQEQVMQIASNIANYTMAEADNLRRAMSKKKVGEMEREKPKFIEGAKKNRIPEAKAERIWVNMETFGQYGFNKSHSTAYAMISFQTAYLKAHFPIEFMAALLTSEKNNRDNIVKYIAECRDMGIKVLPPDINESQRDFSVAGESIRFGLAAVKNVGEGAVDAIIENREKEGAVTSLFDFLHRVDMRKINKKVLESLIKCGALDSLEKNRAMIMEGLEVAMETAQRRQQERLNGQFSLFQTSYIGEAMEPALPAVDPWKDQELLAYEKEMLGFYVTGHPLLQFSKSLPLIVNVSSDNIREKKDGQTVSLAGVVSNIREIATKRKETMAYLTIDDMKGLVTVIVFPELYRNSFAAIQGGKPLLVRGKVDAGDEESKIISTEILCLDEAMETPFTSVRFMINTASSKAEDIEMLKEILHRHRGNYPSFIHLLGDNDTETIISLGMLKIDISEELKKRVDDLFGSGATQFV